MKLENKTKYLILVFALTFIFNLILRWDIIFSELLIEDDNIHVTQILLNNSNQNILSDIQYKTRQKIFKFTVDTIGDLANIRLFYVFLFSLSAAATFLFADIIFRDTHISFISTQIAFLSPLLVSQIAFLVGSYSVLAYFLGINALLISYYILIKEITFTFKIFLSFVTAFLYLLSSRLSPTLMLWPLSLFSLFLLIPIEKLKSKKESVYFILGIFIATGLIILYLNLQVSTHHYANMVGWVHYNFSNYIKIINQYIYICIGAYVFDVDELYLFVLICLSLGVLSFLYSSIKEKQLIRILKFVNLIFLSGISIAPLLVLNQVKDRYYYPSIIFVLLACIYLIHLAIKKRKTKLITLYLIFGLSILSFINFQDKYQQSASMQEDLVSKLIDKEKSKWLEDAQVLVIVNSQIPASTAGFNHWGTWFLRYHTGNQNIIGLIGREKDLVNYPFVKKYTDHGDAYWKRTGNRDGRMRMLGLEKDRKTFLYKFDFRDGSYENLDCLEIQNFSEALVETFCLSNEKFLDRKVSASLCQQKSSDETLKGKKIISYKIGKEKKIEPINYEGEFQKISGDKSVDGEIIDAKKLDYINISILLSTEKNKSKSYILGETGPPMPFYITEPNFFSIYQLSDTKLKIYSPLGSHLISIQPEKWYKIEFNLDKKERIGNFIVNGKCVQHGVITDIEKMNIGKTYSVGKGFKKRFWKGKIGEYLICTINKNREEKCIRNKF